MPLSRPTPPSKLTLPRRPPPPCHPLRFSFSCLQITWSTHLPQWEAQSQRMLIPTTSTLTWWTMIQSSSMVMKTTGETVLTSQATNHLPVLSTLERLRCLDKEVSIHSQTSEDHSQRMLIQTLPSPHICTTTGPTEKMKNRVLDN